MPIALPFLCLPASDRQLLRFHPERARVFHPGGALLDESLPLHDSVVPQLSEQLWAAIELRAIVELSIQTDARHANPSVLGVLDLPLGQRAVDGVDELQLLFHRKVSSEGVSAIEDLVGLAGDAGAGAGVDLDDPQLVDVVLDQVVN